MGNRYTQFDHCWVEANPENHEKIRTRLKILRSRMEVETIDAYWNAAFLPRHHCERACLSNKVTGQQNTHGISFERQPGTILEIEEVITVMKTITQYLLLYLKASDPRQPSIAEAQLHANLVIRSITVRILFFQLRIHSQFMFNLTTFAGLLSNHYAPL